MILDTNAISALFQGDASLAETLAAEDRHHLPIVAVGEYRYGLARSRDRGRLTRLLDLLVHHSIVLPVDVETSRHYAAVREELRRRGRPIPENDVWIAALVWQHDLAIVSRDEHFDEVPNIQRISW